MTRLLHLAALALLLAPLAAAQPGALDPTFGSDGVRVVPTLIPFGLAVQADGGLVLAGARLDERPALRRLSANGAPDAAFGTDGTATLAVPGGLLLDAISQPDGSLFAVGVRLLDDGFSFQPFAARLTASGQPDPAFGPNGVRLLDGSTFFASVAVGLAPDGGAYVAWSTFEPKPGVLVARFRPDGALDTDYGTDGTASLFAEALSFSQTTAVLVDDAGRLLVTGGADSGDNRFSVFAARVLPDGLLDPTFGTDGVATASTPTGFAAGVGAALGPDGLVVVGYDSYNNSDPGGSGSAFLAVRFSDTGAPDASFGTGGVVFFRGPAGNGSATSVVLDLDGGLILGGSFGEVGDGTEPAVLVRLLADGSLDAAFGTGGFATVVAEGTVEALVQLPDGRLVASGISSEDGFAARLLGPTPVATDPAATTRAPGLALVGPNPVRGRTALRFTPAAPGVARVAVYDARGRTVAVLHDGSAAGPLTLPVDASGWAPGVYVVRAEGAGSSLRLTVVR